MPHALEVQFSSVNQSCLTLCDPMESSTPGFSVHHQLLELAQTHVHSVIQASPPPAFSLSQDHGLSQGVSSLHQVPYRGPMFQLAILLVSHSILFK